jgi:hypothetical protein
MTSPFFSEATGTLCTNTNEPGIIAGRMLPVGTIRAFQPVPDHPNSSNAPQPIASVATHKPVNIRFTKFIKSA